MLNVLLLTALFSCFSFSFWLTDFQLEYLGTDMYVLFYANGVVCIISGFINLLLYPKLGLKWLLVFTSIFGILSSLFMILIQQKVIEREDPESEQLFVAIMVPILIFILCLAIQVGYTAIF